MQSGTLAMAAQVSAEANKQEKVYKMAIDLNDILRKKRQQEEFADRPKIEWFGLGKGKKNPVKVRFLQEFTEDSPTFDSSRGLISFLVEHTSPHNFLRRAECSYDSEGRCFACEMNKVETEFTGKDGQVKRFPWKQQSNMYTWIVTEDGDLQLLSRPAPGNFFDLVHGFATGQGKGSLTKFEFEISKGPQKNDKWNLMPQFEPSFEVPEFDKLPDINTAVARKIPYAEQKKFYIPDEEVQEPSITTVPQSQAKSDNFDW